MTGMILVSYNPVHLNLLLVYERKGKLGYLWVAQLAGIVVGYTPGLKWVYSSALYSLYYHIIVSLLWQN